MTKGILLIVSGPSGVGKGTVCRALLEQRSDLALSVSTTTRLPREGETEGVEYNFTDQEHFKAMVKEGLFLEWAMVHGQHYGTRSDQVVAVLNAGTDLILEIDVQGAAQVRRKMPAAGSVFLAPPSWEALEERITKRGSESAARIKQRLITAAQEMEAYQLYDYLVVNNTVQDAVDLVSAIIDAEKCKVSRGIRPPGLGGE